MKMVVYRRSDDFLRDEIEKALDALVAVEHAAGGAQAQHKFLIARGAETGLEKKTFAGQGNVCFSKCGHLC